MVGPCGIVHIEFLVLVLVPGTWYMYLVGYLYFYEHKLQLLRYYQINELWWRGNQYSMKTTVVIYFYIATCIVYATIVFLILY